MLIATLRNVGGAVMMTIPKSLLEGLGLSANTKVGLSLEDGRMVIAPMRKPHYTLAQLMAECDPTAEAMPEDSAWQDMQPVGREVW